MTSLVVPSHIARGYRAAPQSPVRIKTMRGEFLPGGWSGKNESGAVALGDRVLVLPDQAAKESAGGITYTDDSVERTGYAAESGIVVENGDGAFSWNPDRMTRFEGRKPAPGTRVFFKRYSGTQVPGVDGKLYLSMSSDCIDAMAVSAT